MATVNFITEWFCRINDVRVLEPKHPQANLYPSELVTLGMSFALKGGGERAFYRWLTRDYRPLFHHLPERTRLFRLFKAHRTGPTVFWRNPACWAWPIPMGSNCCIPGAKAAARRNWATRACPIGAGSLGRRWASCSIISDWCVPGTVTWRVCRTRTFARCWPRPSSAPCEQ